ncbi:hypothetical protein SLEP1_g15685 [Rubroshorea leprosula]|uniref:Uncharacterized protein n=1 Tax=Rubroshorea leprosula TaxID=152421 RepID=A0AAV5IU60_9ROSI|nr:hypothetical protein SLEP1_g15685 [Rubroshorea leprosula]
MGLRGRGYGGRRSRGGGFGSSSSSSAEYRKKCAASYAPKTSSSKSWFQDMEDEADCYILYHIRMRNLKTRGEEHPSRAKVMQELEDLCGGYKSLWGKWWTEKHDKELCKEWTITYQNRMTQFGPEYCRRLGMKEIVENVCKGVPSSRSTRHLIDEVLEYCI